MVEPRYQELKKKDVPRITKDGVTAIVIAGEALGVKSPVYTLTPTYYLHFTMEEGSVLEQKIPDTFNAFIYILDGAAEIGGGKNARSEAHYAVCTCC